MTSNRPGEGMNTVRSGESGGYKQTNIHTHNVTANVTHEPFKLTERNSAINSKMLSTYRGADNMKFRIFD